MATLPMYDWPEIRPATDIYWNALSESLSDRGFLAPAALTRTEDPVPLWQNPALILGQTCGLPFVEILRHQVSIIGTPAYDICCGAGSYFSVIVVREESDFRSLHDLAGARFGFNDPLSQSGYAAFLYQLKSEGLPPDFIKRQKTTGSHRKSIQSVASGEVDVAAIDAVTWELARRHEPAAAARLRVIKHTDPTAGLPYITAKRPRRDIDRIHRAVVDAMASLDEGVREELLLMGFAATTDDDYRIIKTRYDSLMPIR
ncbi:MAG: PhnD/SsuA/transferrin family substrate-binding protein [Sneathiella sp.]|nr:PhnD/SsuA/transferrin family substrate-binding protein [Sneathiella sp.]